MKTKLVKTKRLHRGSNEYQYGSKKLMSSHSHDGYRCVIDMENPAKPLFTSLRWEDYMPFMKRFREHLEKIEKEQLHKANVV